MGVPVDSCPCGTGKPLPACCGRYHAGETATHAEQLMRSRYSAYVLGDIDYLRATWHASTCPPDLELDPASGPTIWLGLSIKQFRSTGDDRAEVEFIARYRIGGGSAVRLHERSRFVHEQGRWFYLDGEHF